MKLNRLELIISVSLILVIAVGGFLSGNVMMAMGTAKEDPSQAIESPTPLIGQEPEEMLEVQPEETAFQAVPTVAPAQGGASPAPVSSGATASSSDSAGSGSVRSVWFSSQLPASTPITAPSFIDSCTLIRSG